MTDNLIAVDISDPVLDMYRKTDRYMESTVPVDKPLSKANIPSKISKEGWDKAITDWGTQMDDLNASLVKYLKRK